MTPLAIEGKQIQIFQDVSLESWEKGKNLHFLQAYYEPNKFDTEGESHLHWTFFWKWENNHQENNRGLNGRLISQDSVDKEVSGTWKKTGEEAEGKLSIAAALNWS